MPSTNKDKKEEVSPSSLIYHYRSLVQSLSLKKKKKEEQSNPTALAGTQNRIQFLMKVMQTAVLLDSLNNGLIY